MHPGGLPVNNFKNYFLCFFCIFFAGVTQTWAQESSIKITPLPVAQPEPPPVDSASSASTTVTPTENTTETSLKDILQNKKFQDNHEITDIRMRAEEGSLSRYSLKFNMSYKGSSVATPLGREQPNPDDMVRVTATSLNGSISGRYRLDSNSAVNLSTGITALHPFQGTDRMDLRTPSVSYDVFNRTDDFQIRNLVGASYETVPEYLRVGNVGGLNYTFSVVHDLGTSGFSAGVDTMFAYLIYNRDYQQSDKRISRYNLGFSPSIKYNFSDRLSASNNVVFSFWNPRFLKNSEALWSQTVSDRIGLGYAFTKDVYISPFIGCYPGKLAWDTTTVNIASIFSLM